MSHRKDLNNSITRHLHQTRLSQLTHAYLTYLSHTAHITPPLTSLTQLSTAVPLLLFIQEVTHKTLHFHKNPPSQIHSRDNFELLFSAMKQHNLPVTVTAQDFFDANKNTLLTFLSSLINHFLFNGRYLHASNFANYIQKVLNRDWDIEECKSAGFWSELTCCICGDDEVKRVGGENEVERMKGVFRFVKEKMGIPEIVDVEVMCRDGIDDDVLAMYLAYFARRDERSEDDEEIGFLREGKRGKGGSMRRRTVQLALSSVSKEKEEEKKKNEEKIKLKTEDGKELKRKESEEKESSVVEAYLGRRDLFEVIGESEVEMKRLKDENERMRRLLDERTHENKELVKKVEEMKDDICKNEKLFEEEKEKNKGKEGEIAILREQNEKVVKEITSLRKQLEEKNEIDMNHEKLFEETREELLRIKSDDDEREHEIVALQTEVNELRGENDKMRNEMKKIDRVKEELLVEKRQKAEVDSELKQLRQRIEEIEAFGVVEEEDRKSLFISLALAVKLAVNTKVSNEIVISDLYESVVEKKLRVKEWNSWLFTIFH